MPDDTLLMNEIDAARYLGGERTPISVRTLQHWRVTGGGPAFLKIGAAVRYRKADLDDYLGRCRRTSTSAA